MDGCSETETIDLTLDDDDDFLDSTLPSQWGGGDALKDEDTTSITSLETLPMSVHRMETVLGVRDEAGRGLSTVAEDDDGEEEAEEGATADVGSGKDGPDVVVPAEAASSPFSRRSPEQQAEPIAGADAPDEEPLFPWIDPFHVSRPTFQFDKGQVTVREIPGDGHCLFRACLHQRRSPSHRKTLPSDAEVHRLRTEVAAYMRQNRDKYRQFFSDRILDHNISAVEQGDWGNGAALSAIANMWRCHIEVYLEMGALIQHHPDHDGADSRPEAPPLRLAYRCADDDGNYVHNHYDSVEKVVLDAAITAPQSPPPCPSTEEPELPRPASSPEASSSARSTAPSPRSKRKRTLQRGTPAHVPKRPGGPTATSTPFAAPCAAPFAAGGPAATSTPFPASCAAGFAAGVDRNSSQDLVEPASPAPALTAPGSPHDECVSASQETLRAKQGAAASDARAAVPTRLRLYSISSGGGDHQDTTVEAPLLTGKDPSLAAEPSPDPSDCHLDLTHLPGQVLSAAEKTSEWLANLTNFDIEVDEVIAAFASSPDPEDEGGFAEDVSEVTQPASPRLDDEAKVVSDAQCCISSVVVCDTVIRSYSNCSISAPRKTKSAPKLGISTRTISTNVALSHGKLIGTFQTFY